MRRREIKTIEDAEQEIERLTSRDGEHTHNLIGFVLRKVDSLFGKEKANDLIDQYDLNEYGINKE